MYSFVKCGCLIYFISQFCKSDMSRYGYLEVFPRVLGLRDKESRLHMQSIPPTTPLKLFNKETALKTLEKLQQRV